MLKRLWERINQALQQEAEEYVRLYRAAMQLSRLTGEEANEIISRARARAKELQCDPVDIVLRELITQGKLLQFEGKRARRRR